MIDVYVTNGIVRENSQVLNNYVFVVLTFYRIN